MVDVFKGRMFYSDEEIVGHLRERCKSERERRDVKDTNITSTISSLRKEVPARLASRKIKEVLINSQPIIRQLPKVGEVLIQLVH